MYRQLEIGTKRRREMEMQSEIRSAIEELSSTTVVKLNIGDIDSAQISTKPFLSVCNLVLQVLDKIGPTMAVLRQDMDQNIQRLEKVHESECLVYSNLVEILKKEAREGNAKKGTSCSKAFLWLTRSLDFSVALLQVLVEDFGRSMEQAVEEAYKITLRPWHGWISTAAYKVALKLVPDTKTFLNTLMAKDEDLDILKEDLQALVSILIPLLEQVHTILRSYGLDSLKCT